MASNGSSLNISQPANPIFTGQIYQFWSIKMKTLFKSQDLWDLIKTGYADPENFAAATTSRQAWRILQTEFQGSSKVIVVKLQILRHEFETLIRKENESVQDFLSRTMAIISQMRSYGDQITDQTVVEIFLRSLTPKFDHVVAAIEESKDLSKFSFDELIGSLQAHEARINRPAEKQEEKAFQSKMEAPNSRDHDKATTGRGRGRGAFRGNSRGRGRGRGSEQRHFNDQRGNRSNKQCHHCKKFRHVQADCWYKEKQVNYAETTNEESKLFMAYRDTNEVTSDMWFVDSGCSNHMTGMKLIFKELDETQKTIVRLGDNNGLQAEGKGTVAIKSSHGKVKLLHDVQFVPSLAHNLLSVGQLMATGHSLFFDDGACIIKDKKSGQTLVNVLMTETECFR